MSHLEFDVIWRTWPYVLGGLQYTVQLTVVATVGGILFGTLLAMLRLASNPVLASIAAGYVNFMRSVPLLLVIFWFYFLMPVIAQWVTGADRPPVSVPRIPPTSPSSCSKQRFFAKSCARASSRFPAVSRKLRWPWA